MVLSSTHTTGKRCFFALTCSQADIPPGQTAKHCWLLRKGGGVPPARVFLYTAMPIIWELSHRPQPERSSRTIIRASHTQSLEKRYEPFAPFVPRRRSPSAREAAVLFAPGPTPTFKTRRPGRINPIRLHNFPTADLMIQELDSDFVSPVTLNLMPGEAFKPKVRCPFDPSPGGIRGRLRLPSRLPKPMPMVSSNVFAHTVWQTTSRLVRCSWDVH